MKFPSIGDIATKDLATVQITDTINKAIDVMLKHEHRNVIVVDNDKFFILTVLDVLDIESKTICLDEKLSKLNLKEVSTIDKKRNILDALEYLNNDIEYICVLNKDNSLYGIVTHTDITSNIDPDTLMDNYTLQDFLKLGKRMKWVSKNEITSILLTDMINNLFDNVVIVEDNKPIGILTTKDVMRLIKHREELSLPISAHMSSPVDTIINTSSIKDALVFVKEKHYKRVVVVNENGDIAGVISQKELISLTYAKWAILMKEYQAELSEINNLLENQNKEFEIKASTDLLTGLYNRHKFSELYLSSYKSMIQRHNDLSLLIMDIDHFKNVNDSFGHNTGDKVLVQVSHVLLKTLRNIDIVCRWGGEEFIVLLPTSSLETAYKLAEKLRINIESVELDVVGHITCSFGVSQVVEGDEMVSVINRADNALYLAKNSGRNCVKTENDLTD
ncbi:diguanylate cyclase [Sulfurimonas sp.]|nr:diguanylate cyclase [Sulfurimonas sp.]